MCIQYKYSQLVFIELSHGCEHFWLPGRSPWHIPGERTRTKHGEPVNTPRKFRCQQGHLPLSRWRKQSQTATVLESKPLRTLCPKDCQTAVTVTKRLKLCLKELVFTAMGIYTIIIPTKWIPSWRVNSPFLLDPRRLHVFLCNWPWWSVPVHESQRRLLLGSRSGQCGPWPRSSSTVDMSMYLLPLAMPDLFVHEIVWPDRHDTWSRVSASAGKSCFFNEKDISVRLSEG